MILSNKSFQLIQDKLTKAEKLMKEIQSARPNSYGERTDYHYQDGKCSAYREMLELVAKDQEILWKGDRI